LNGLQNGTISTPATFYSGVAQEQGVQNETRNNGGLETKHQGRSGSNLSHHAETSNAELPETLAGMC